jgi:hypothetical protein
MIKKKKIKKNQYYKLVEYIQKQNIAKVFNFRTNKVEVYSTVLTKKERYLQNKIRREQLAVQKVKKKKIDLLKNPIYLMYRAINYYAQLHIKHKKSVLTQNSLVESIIIRRYFKNIEKSRYNNRFFLFFNNFFYRKLLNASFRKHNKYANVSLNIISVYIILRRKNIYVTVVKDGQVSRIFAPCLFRHIPKHGKKKSMSFFYTVKRTIMYITRFFFNKKKKYFLKIFFKGFQKFKRPLLSRFFFNRRLKMRCIGISNIDFESFNGCRLRKSKRIQIRGQRKQGRKFSF